jgi:N-carbamoyl-L-amino-acid hydrolase
MTDRGKLDRVVAAVSEDRLWQRHLDTARFGATPRGGINRAALSAEDIAVRRWLLDWAEEREFEASVDAIGNMFIRRPGSHPESEPVVSGSHMDTQPAGGKFDGIFGVLAALEVLDAANDAGVATRRPVEVVIWCNEEGGRFQPTTMGSAVFAGALPLATALATVDQEGTTVEAALAETMAAVPVAGRREFGFPMAAYLEAHIEQGPVLEATDHTIGVVTGIQGLRWFTVEVEGEDAHAGTTPRGRSRDAFVAASDMALALRELMHEPEDVVRFTIGRFELTPNSPNTVPGRVLFTIDFRHPDQSVLDRLGDQVEPLCRQHAGSCRVSVTETLNAPPTEFDPRVLDLIRASAARQGVSHMDIVSGATHDAKYMTGRCPSGMIFVPCEKGISHNESENAAPADLTAGARVLAEVMVTLANQ